MAHQNESTSVPPVSPVRTQGGDSWEKMTRQVKSSGNLKFGYGRRMGFLSVCRYFLPNRGKSRSRRTKQSGLPAIDHRLTIPRNSATLSLEVTSSPLKSILTSGITCLINHKLLITSFKTCRPLLGSSRVSVSSNVSAMSHSRHSYSECLGNVLK